MLDYNIIKDAIPAELLKLANKGDKKAINAIGRIAGAKEIASYLPAAGALITAFVSGYESYKEAIEDGVITDREKANIGLEAGFDGLMAVAVAAITLACPVAGAAVGVIYFIADQKYDFSKMFADSTLDNIDLAFDLIKYIKQQRTV